MLKSTADEPWYAALPAPQATAHSIPRTHLLSWLQRDKVAGKDFVLVDLRRTDYEVNPSIQDKAFHEKYPYEIAHKGFALTSEPL